jgi:hypothetical protein
LQDYYKIVELDQKGNIKTLFHGIDGSRVLSLNTWLNAEMKFVKDGTSKTEYLSGWHILESPQECRDYLEFFKHKHNKRIVKCKAKNVWPKSHSRHPVFLAEKIFIEGMI